VADFAASRRTRAIGAVLAALLAIFTLGGFFGVPLLVSHLAAGRLTAALSRQVSVGRVAFNPYTLRLRIERLHIAGRDRSHPFVDIAELRAVASWKSLWRLAPIIRELTIDGPTVHVVRTAAHRFNFSDLIKTSNEAPAAQPSQPFHFAVSNILLNNGAVRFDDQVLHQHHAAENIQIGLPFIANLPADVEIFVQPMVEMTIDGSQLRVAGMAKPFAAIPESVLDLKLDQLDLARYASYLPVKVPIKIPRGTLSTDVQLHFIQSGSGAVIRLAGSLTLDQIDVRDGSNAPLAAFKRATVTLTDVEPLGNIVALGGIDIDGLNANLVLKRGGATNFTPLTAALASPPAQPAATPAPSTPLQLSLQSLQLSNSGLKFTDAGAPTPIELKLDAIHIGFKNFRTVAPAAPAAFDVNAHLGSGSLALKGTFDLAHSQVGAEVTLDQIDLPPLQPFVRPFLAGTIASGKLAAHAKLTAGIAPSHFNIRAQPAGIALSGVEVRPPDEDNKPVQLARLSVTVGQFDLAERRVMVTEVRTDGLHLFVRRLRSGQYGVLSFLRTLASASPPSPGSDPAKPAPPTQRERPPEHQPVATLPRPAPKSGAVPAAPAKSWQYKIESVAMENTDATFEDDVPPQPMTLAIAPLNLHLKGLSSDFTKPFELEVDGALAPKSSFKIDGNASLTPLKANLRVVTKRLDLTPAYTYVSSRLNAEVTRAALTMDGAVEVAAVQGAVSGSYRGNLTLANVRMRDKVSNDRFLRWDAFNANHIEAEFGGGSPKVHIGEMALADFYARVILNSDGKLNLRDVTANPQAAPTSLTRTRQAPEKPVAPHEKEPAAANKGPVDADIELGRIVLQGGNVNFTDNFIKPNYTVDLTDIAGTIGSFGTRSTRPAPVALQGEVNGSAPIDIDGSFNPLAPTAFIDIKAKANGIDLPNLTPYSRKYTGYPILKGTLTVDVHYHLDQGKLTANNHLFIDQLTFGDRVQSPNAVNLPLALGVSLLKNSRGEIDVTVPVSGSLNDPQFSVGEIILKAFSNLILKAAASPFTLLASAVGAPNKRLDYIEFAPGLATLSPDATKRLSILAKALQDRPGLRLSISGRVDPKVDREGLRNALMERRIKAQKVKELRERGESVNIETVEIAPDEYNKYLERAYKAAKFSKPRNFLGLTKSLPPEEMKKLMLDNTEVTDQDLEKLAAARAAAVRRYLSKKVDPVRLAVVAPHLNAEGVEDKGKPTRVDLAIQ
jgi:Domain of Unknown Function (DUF748)